MREHWGQQEDIGKLHLESGTVVEVNEDWMAQNKAPYLILFDHARYRKIWAPGNHINVLPTRPDNRTSSALRFHVGARVSCDIGGGRCTGTVI